MKTYGKAWLAEGKWNVAADPHILLRLRRVFERINKAEFGTVTLADTMGNARDLEWFEARYPLAIADDDRAALAASAAGHREHILTIEKLIDADYVPRHFDCPIPPRDYQARAAEITLKQGFLLVADELGLGKTFEAILCFTDPRCLPAVVVCYPHLQRQWAAEVAKFAPDLRTHIVKKGMPYPLPKFKRDGIGEPRGPDVVIITYSKLAGWAETLAGYCHGVIFDEIQELRRSGTAKYVAARHVAGRCAIRQGLTATPIFNYGAEMYNVLEVLKPGALGTNEEFTREWCAASKKGQIIRDPKAFGSYLRENCLMLRRTRADVGRELPDVIRIPHRVDADAKALSDVEDSAHELARIIMGRSEESFRGQRLNASEQLSNLLRQATGIAKAPYVADFVNLLLEAGEPVLLAGWHRAVYRIWESKLGKANRRIGWYTGSETPAAKAATRAKFMAGELDVIFLSLRSGAGLDGLQEICKTIVFGELDWSPAVHEQAIGRINRDGQIAGVTAYFLVSDEGADPVMSEVLGLKREQLEGIRSPNQDIVEQLTTIPGHVRRLAEDFLAKRGESTAPVPPHRPPLIEKSRAAVRRFVRCR